MKAYQMGLALSGGAAWGLANIGVLEVLEREGIKPDCIAGSSMGAIVGGLYALGISVHDMRLLMQDIHFNDAVHLSEAPFKGGLQGGLFRQNLRKHLKKHIGTATIKDCSLPFVCIAGKLKGNIHWHRIVKKGFTSEVLPLVEPVIFPPETPLLDALMASSAIPVLFSPVKIGSDRYVDLVHFGSIPTRSLKKAFHPKVIIATDTNPSYTVIKKFLPPGWREFLERGMESLDKSREAADLVIRPNLKGNMFRFDKAETFRKAGMKAAEEAIPRLQGLG